jgi:hypothetical protein
MASNVDLIDIHTLNVITIQTACHRPLPLDVEVPTKKTVPDDPPDFDLLRCKNDCTHDVHADGCHDTAEKWYPFSFMAGRRAFTPLLLVLLVFLVVISGTLVSVLRLPEPTPVRCAPCTNTPVTLRGIVAYVVYGTDERYHIGALRNAELVPSVYPDARAWFVVHPDVESNLGPLLRHRGALVYTMTPARLAELGLSDLPLPAWSALRYIAPDVLPVDEWDYILFRDADSRLSLREQAAVREWLTGGWGFHVMRDHPHHSARILAGMFGMRREAYGPVPFRMCTLLRDHGQYAHKPSFDQTFLGNAVWPLISNLTRVHDSYYCLDRMLQGALTTGFPTKRDYDHQIVGGYALSSDMPMSASGVESPEACRRYPGWRFG